ncbi:MAG: SRPBCC family protein [SAR324 cluster bacterium]|nr:SRPBCC family protein [SAR324 cluster bacterium]
MAHHVKITLPTKINPEKLWQIISDFSSVERFSSSVKSSPIISDIKTGVGTTRKCTLYDQGTLVEKITEIDEGKGLKFAVTEFSLPLVSLVAGMGVTDQGDGTGELYMEMNYVVKYGPIGFLMGSLMMPMMMKKMMKSILTGLAFHAQSGETIGEEMPSSEKLNFALSN